jgi:clan AA aspartic protease
VHPVIGIFKAVDRTLGTSTEFHPPPNFCNKGEQITMGLIFAEIELTNPRDPHLRPLKQQAVVDSGAITLCVPEHVAIQLKLAELEKRDVTTAEGRYSLVPYVGPVQIRFENRNCFTGALVMGDSVLLGAAPLDDMDLVINPRLQQVTVNPESPNIPTAIVKTSN